MIEPFVCSDSDLTNKIVLLVEDNDDDVQIIRHVLKRSKIDANLFVVNDGDCAIHFVNKQHDFESAPDVDLMLLDLKMPRVDGFEVLKILKRDSQKCVFPIVVMLSVINDDICKKIMKYGCDGFFEKPLTVEELCKIKF